MCLEREDWEVRDCHVWKGPNTGTTCFVEQASLNRWGAAWSLEMICQDTDLWCVATGAFKHSMSFGPLDDHRFLENWSLTSVLSGDMVRLNTCLGLQHVEDEIPNAPRNGLQHMEEKYICQRFWVSMDRVPLCCSCEEGVSSSIRAPRGAQQKEHRLLHEGPCEWWVLSQKIIHTLEC